MEKTQASPGQAQHQVAAADGMGVAIASPAGGQIAQLQSLADRHPQAQRFDHVRGQANNSTQAIAQRQAMHAIEHSPRMVAQAKAAPGMPQGHGVIMMKKTLRLPNSNPRKQAGPPPRSSSPRMAARESSGFP